jgi:hypothetical protein
MSKTPLFKNQRKGWAVAQEADLLLSQLASMRPGVQTRYWPKK